MEKVIYICSTTMKNSHSFLGLVLGLTGLFLSGEVGAQRDLEVAEMTPRQEAGKFLDKGY